MTRRALHYSEDEQIIAEAILEARKVQEYIWGEMSLLERPYVPEVWASVFQKRVDKISELNTDNQSCKIELRKRVLQQAALSILALKVLDK